MDQAGGKTNRFENKTKHPTKLYLTSILCKNVGTLFMQQCYPLPLHNVCNFLPFILLARHQHQVYLLWYSHLNSATCCSNLQFGHSPPDHFKQCNLLRAYLILVSTNWNFIIILRSSVWCWNPLIHRLLSLLFKHHNIILHKNHFLDLKMCVEPWHYFARTLHCYIKRGNILVLWCLSCLIWKTEGSLYLSL